MRGNEEANSPRREQAGWNQREKAKQQRVETFHSDVGFQTASFFIRSLKTWLRLIREFVTGTESVQTRQKWPENSRVANRHTNEGEEEGEKKKKKGTVAHIVLELSRNPKRHLSKSSPTYFYPSNYFVNPSTTTPF